MLERDLFAKTSGLHREPFRNEPDPYFYFTYEAFEQRLETLRRLLQSGEPLTVIVGDRGSGKTTLLQRYLSDFDDDSWKIYRLRISGASRRSTAEIHSAYMLREPVRLMILDDAQLLAPHNLRMLIQEALADASGEGIHLVLVGQPKIEKTVVDAVRSIDSEKAVNRIYMPPLAPEESEEYLRHRLTVAGYSGPTLFSRSDLRKLHRTSGGLPGRINTAARQYMQARWRHLRGNTFHLFRKLCSGIGLTGLAVLLMVGFAQL